MNRDQIEQVLEKLADSLRRGTEKWEVRCIISNAKVPVLKAFLIDYNLECK
jgi:hypothetical protein